MTDSPKIKLNLKALHGEKTMMEEAIDSWESPFKEEITHESDLKSIEKNEAVEELFENKAPENEEQKKEVLEEEEKKPSKNIINIESINKHLDKNKKTIETEEEKNTDAWEAKSNVTNAVWNQEKQEWEDEKQEVEQDTEVHFANYTSYFEKQSKTVFKKIQNFRYAPKTRTWLLLSLVVFTCLLIGGLMILFPEKHSLQLYKASILDIYNNGAITNVRQDDVTVSTDIPDFDSDNDDDTWEDEAEEENSSGNTGSWLEDMRKNKLQEHLLNKYRNE